MTPSKSSKGDSPALETGRSVLIKESQALARLVDRLDASFERAVETLTSCKGRVVVTGMGKSGFMARKIAATLSSTGTPAMYVHPAEAAHGDLGGIVQGDVVIAVSYGGETEEILRVLPLFRETSSCLIALTGRIESSVARAANIVLDVSVPAEANPLGLAPTSSTTAAVAMGDALAMAVAQAKGFSADDFGRNHPGGSLGRRFLRVSEIMHAGEQIPVVEPGTRIRDVIHEMNAKRLGMTTVVKDGRLVGVISNGDMQRLFERVPNPLQLTAAEVMTTRPRTCPPDILAWRALEIMEAPPQSVLWVVVVDGEQHPLGIVEIHDIYQTARP